MRFSHGFLQEDMIGRLVDSMSVTQKKGIEKGTLESWYTGWPGRDSHDLRLT